MLGFQDRGGPEHKWGIFFINGLTFMGTGRVLFAYVYIIYVRFLLAQFQNRYMVSRVC